MFWSPLVTSVVYGYLSVFAHRLVPGLNTRLLAVDIGFGSDFAIKHVVGLTDQDMTFYLGLIYLVCLICLSYLLPFGELPSPLSGRMIRVLSN